MRKGLGGFVLRSPPGEQLRWRAGGEAGSLVGGSGVTLGEVMLGRGAVCRCVRPQAPLDTCRAVGLWVGLVSTSKGRMEGRP